MRTWPRAASYSVSWPISGDVSDPIADGGRGAGPWIRRAWRSAERLGPFMSGSSGFAGLPPRLAGRPTQYPAYVTSLFVLFAAYLAVPIVELPVLGLSLSAVLMVIIADRVLLKGNLYFGPRYRPFSWLFVLLALGVLLSASFAIMADRAAVPMTSLRMVLRFMYWSTVSFVTMRIVAEVDIQRRLGLWIQRGVKLLTVVLAVAVFLGVELLTPNMFAVQLTMFSPFLLPGLLRPGKPRLNAGLWLGAIWGLSLMNGSRQGLIVLALQLVLFFGLVAVHSKRRLRAFLLAPVLAAVAGVGLWGAITFAPASITDRITRKVAATEAIDSDKSWQFRLVKNQHARRVFASSPIVGVGVGGMRESEVPLDLPAVFRGASLRQFYDASSHNSHLQMLAETGLIGFVPWVSLLGILLLGGLSVMRDEIRGERYFVLAAFLGVAGISVQLWVIAAHTSTAPFFLFGCLAGAIVKARSRQRASSRALAARPVHATVF